MAAVGARYARALMDVVSDPKAGVKGDAIRVQLRSFLAAYASSEELRNVLSNPSVPAPKKRAIVEEIGKHLQLPRIALNFLFVLVDHRRMGMLAEILDIFEGLLDESQGVLRAEVTTAVDLAPAERQVVETSLARLTGSKVRAHFEVDPALIGGVRARIGSTIYDGSIREQLRTIKERLSQQYGAV